MHFKENGYIVLYSSSIRNLDSINFYNITKGATMYTWYKLLKNYKRKFEWCELQSITCSHQTVKELSEGN